MKSTEMFCCKYSRRSRFHLCYWNCLFFFFFPALFQIKIFSHFICFLYGSLYQASDTIILFLLFEYVYLSSTIKLSIQSGNMHNFICYTLCKLYSDLFICLFFILAFIYFSLILLGFISSNGECKNIFAEQYRQEHWWFFWYIWNLIYECQFFFPHWMLSCIYEQKNSHASQPFPISPTLLDPVISSCFY